MALDARRMSCVRGALVAMAVGASAAAAPTPVRAADDPTTSAAAICNAVAGQILENVPERHTRYRYQTRILDAAGVSMETPPSARIAAIQGWWLQTRGGIRCREVRQGDLLRLAIARHNKAFLADAISGWKLDLNYVNPDDGGTALDFVAQLRRTYDGTAVAQTFDTYSGQLRAAGAKTAGELAR